jgi:hypothetical protein
MWIFASAPNGSTFMYFALATHDLTVLRRIDPLLGNDHETNNETTAFIREQNEHQQLSYNRRTAFSTRSVPRCHRHEFGSS